MLRPLTAHARRAVRAPRRPFLAAAAAVAAALARAPGTALAAGPSVRTAQRPTGALTESALAEMEAYVAGALERFGVPGASVAVVQGGALRFARGFGVTELGGGGRPVGPDTRFIIGSVPKSMTALLVATLVDEGRLGWDTPVVEALPQFTLADPAATAAVTFRDLLSMRSGLPRFDGPLFFRPLTPEEVVESLREVPLSAPPGEVFGYTNQGYATAGFAAAAAAGATYGRDLYPTYARLMQERLYDPAGMTRTALDFDAGAADPDRAGPHAVDLLLGRRTAVPLGLERGGFSVIPAGGTTWASAGDLARYLLLHLGRGVAPGGRRLVSEAGLLETRKPHTPMGGGTHFGLGWVVGEYRDQEHLTYGGGNLGYTSYVALLPALDLGVAVLTNASLAAPFTHAVADHVFEAALGLEHTADAGHLTDEQEIGALLAQLGGGLRPRPEPGEVAALLGRYGPEPGVEVRAGAAGALFLGTAFGDFPLYPVAGQAGAFLVGIGPGVTATFAPGERGAGAASLTIGWLLGDPQPPLIMARTGDSAPERALAPQEEGRP
jgi:CubicO group peptidase (beta-lactamase class C family)